MSSFGDGGHVFPSGSSQFGRSPLPTGLKRLHSESSDAAASPKVPRHSSTSGRLENDSSTACNRERERLLHLVCSDLWELHSKHQRHLAELYFLDTSGFYLDFESWLNSSPPELPAHLQAHGFDIIDFLNSIRPSGSSSGQLVSSSTSGSADRYGASPNLTVPKSPARIGLPTSAESNIISSRRPTVESDQQQTVASTTSAMGRSTLEVDSKLLLETSASGPVSSTGVLPVITMTAPFPSAVSSPVAATTPASSPATTPSRSFLEAHLISKQSGSPGRPPGAHRGPGRPPGKKNASNIINGSRYKAATTDGRIQHAAKQEVAVLHRISELRREGLWSADKLPKCADPLRSKTHWDFLLEEMKWMAMDFEQERRLKKSSAKKLAAMVVRQRKEEEEKQKRTKLDREKELKRIASFTAKEIRQFWNNVEKVVEYKVDSIVEAKKKRALDKHLDFIVGQTEKFSSLVQEGLVGTSASSVPSSESAPEERGDSDFELDESSEDDESTIDKEEKHVNKDEVDEEVAELQRECDMELDDILESLPPGYLDDRTSEEAGPSTSSETSPDAGNMSESSEDSDNENEEGSTSPVETEKLPEDIDFSKLRSDNSDVRQQELTHFAETAEKLQPKGYTLETTTVVTKVPFLLKHQLREYQHVGLDWLVTLFDRKLNGILADEMGLGKTIQTIALLAHLACEKGNWGPHLIIVPTTVMLNWEMELKKWCPAFKILTYYGSVKERKEKRHGWSKPNAFHVCITSYKLVLQDHLVFRRKKWEYLILDEAQNIKNFKSQRWQMLLHFNAQRRLLLTGTPLQNSLMELWSLMHFLMPEIFASHRDFKDWFSNPVTDMIEGSREYNEQTVRRLHKVLRPFLLRRLKSEVEKQLPKKYEHVVTCPLSKRQRYLYDDFMSRASTKDQLSTGNVMSVLNILMQLRKVCNHPNLFESRPITSPFVMRRLTLVLPSAISKMATDKDSMVEDDIPHFLLLQRCRRDACIRCKQLAPDRRLIEELSDDQPCATSPPSVSGFKFTPLKAPMVATSRQADPGPKRRNFQFVIPPNVAQDLDFEQPFLVQIQAPSGPKVVPIQLRSPAPEALKKIGLSAQANGQAAPSSISDPIQLPVFRLSQPSQQSVAALQPPPTGTGIRATTSRLAVVTRGAESEAGPRPGFSVTLVPQPGSQVRPGSNAGDNVIRTRTVMWRPAAGLQAAAASGILRPCITVQQTGTRTPPIVRYVDPSRSGLSSLPSSKPSTPVASPAVAPSSPNAYASAVSLLPSPGESAASEGDPTDRVLDSSPKSNESAEKPSGSVPRAVSVGEKRPASSDISLGPVAKRRSMEHRQQVLQSMATENERKNLFEPLYGSELSELVSVRCDDPIVSLRKTFSDVAIELEPLISHFSIYTPPVLSGLPLSTCSSRTVTAELESVWPDVNSPFKPVIDSQLLHFPELRLIEYDCGKLQILTHLLRALKEEGHRCLIFTQMTKMLDILEGFLSYLGMKYLRLDGATQIELRQVVMERFNQDARIFCLILSTRSGGLGVNLTGADTVIFYDSDWNPTMDAQAQDRCHRIGQTRDVHIYRLISEKTVEENILCKAAQKRRLGEVAIEEGSFTTEFFRKGNLKEIFDLSDDVAVRADETGLSQQELEQQMATLEDENDVQATRCARAETNAELSEFDENQATGIDEYADPDILEVENKMRQLMTELKPVERYAVKYLETLYEPDRLDELQQTEDQIQQRKQKWEAANRERLEHEEQERRREEEEEFDLTYAYEDSLAQMFCPSDPMEPMPIWMPPTPPMSDSEFEPYIDTALGYLYNLEPMEEGDLPPVSGELDLFRTPTKSEVVAPVQPSTPMARPPSATISDIPAAVAETVANIRNSFNKTPKEGQQRSLFDGGAATYRPKRDVRRPATPPSPGFAEQESTEFPEWGVLDDYALLQAVTKGQQMAYNLLSTHPGYVANWDYISKLVSSAVGRFCSPRACHNRYQYVILPREEGRMVTIDAITKKARKLPLSQQDIGNVKKFRVRTGQQFKQEGASTMVAKLEQRFTAVRKAMMKRVSTSRERGLGLANCLPATVVTRRRHDAHVQSLGYNPDKICSPGELAEKREKRLKEMKEQHQLQQQQQAAAMAFQNQTQQPVQISYQPQVPQQQMQPVQSLPQYPQTTLQSQNVVDTQHPLAIRSTVPISGAFGISSTPGTPHQQQIQVSMQHQGQSQMDNSQISVSIHPASRLMTGGHHRQAAGAIVASQAGSTGANIAHMLASGSPRPQGIGVAGVGARSSLATPAGVTTATVYRQVSASGGILRAQRTPPSTPAPSGAHPGTSVQATPGTIHQRTPSMVQSGSLTAIPISGIESSATSLIGPVIVQTPPTTTVRFQTVSSLGGRQKIQFGSAGGFLVSADNKSTVTVVPPTQMPVSSHGSAQGHQTITPISITAANAARGTTVTPRHSLQLSHATLGPGGKKNLALPRIATFTHGSNRGAPSPVHLVASSVGGRIAATQAMHGARAPSPSQLIRGGPGAGATGRNIPSISMLMPPVGRMETIQGTAGVTASGTGSSPGMQGQHMGIATTSAAVLSPQGGPTTSQGFGSSSNRGQ